MVTTTLLAQRRQRAPDALPNTPYDGKFTFVRIRYNPGGMGGEGGFGYGDPRWNHDYPRAEGHFGKILSELSLVPTYLGGGNVLTFDDPELFKYPIAYLTEPGFWSANQKEAEGMRNWLAKGGFLIFDDFVRNEWYNFEAGAQRCCPRRGGEARASHPIFDSFFRIESLDMRTTRNSGERSRSSSGSTRTTTRPSG